MKLVRPVTNPSGMVMLGENTELTPALIDRIRNMNIDGVYVHGFSQPTIPKEEMLDALEERFRPVENQPHMADLKRLMREHLEELYA